MDEDGTQHRDPRVDLLYRESPVTLTFVQSGADLANDQLQVYGRTSGVYRVLGQVAIGYLSTKGPKILRSSERRRRGEPYAVTLQAVQGGEGDGGVLLNVIGFLPDGKPALEAIEESNDARLADAIAKSRRRLADIALESVPRKKRSRERRRRALDVLRRLSRNLERIFRQRTRRTQHSEARHENKNRPASSAFSDALTAKDGAIYRDVEEKTWVVVGPKRRVHVFNDDGVHITSVVYPGETIRHRTTKGKWISSKKAELEDFRAALKSRSQGER